MAAILESVLLPLDVEKIQEKGHYLILWREEQEYEEEWELVDSEDLRSYAPVYSYMEELYILKREEAPSRKE